MTEVQGVLFDLDDTICRYRRSADEVLAVAFDRAGVDPFFEGREYVERFDEFADAGATIEAVRSAAFAEFARESGVDPDLGRAVAEAYAAERDHSAVEFTRGAKQAVDALTGRYPLAIVTDGDPEMQSTKLSTLGIADRFETVVHGGHDAPAKPDPEPFAVALDALGVTPSRAVHVGNSTGSDVRGANAAGLTSVWLRNGASRRPLDSGPDPHYVVDSLAELADEPWR